MIIQGAETTENQDFELRNKGTAIHFIGTSGRVPTCRPNFCDPKLWP